MTFDFDECLKQEREEKEDAVKHLKAILAKAKMDGITGTLEVSYDGVGDSGEFYYSDSHDKFKSWCSVNDIEYLGWPSYRNKDLDKEKKFYMLEALGKIPPGGWEINEGAWGTITLDFDSGKIHHEHNQRVEESIYSEENF